MPKATVNIQDTEVHDLKTLPAKDGEEGGVVTLRRMSYGQVIQRRAMVSAMKVHGGKGKNFEGEINMMQEGVTLFEFQHCIVDHNLTGDDDQPLDLRSPLAIKALDPRVGQEIETYIGKMNNFEEDDDEEGNS
jgi:hypothetical protein